MGLSVLRRFTPPLDLFERKSAMANRQRKYTPEQRIAWGKQIVEMKSKGLTRKEASLRCGAPEGSAHYFEQCYLDSVAQNKGVVRSAPKPRVVENDDTVALLIGRPAQISEALQSWLGGRK